MYTLRPFQQDDFNRLRLSFREGNRAVLYQAGTGAGKTVVASLVAKIAEERRNRVLAVAHRRELIFQMQQKLYNMGVYSGIIMSDIRPQVARLVQVGSIQTLWARYLKEGLTPIYEPRLIIIDEAHRCISKTYLELLKAFPNAWVLGLTATPVRSDGLGLGHVYDDMICAPTVAELTQMGYLVPVRYFEGVIPNLKGLGRGSDHDYNKKQLEKRMNKAELIGDCVENWLRHAKGRPTLCFASGVRHSIALAEAFNEAGVPAMHVDGTTHKDDRDHALERLSSGNIQVITNCMVYTEGVDCPPVSCIQSANPTKSIIKYFQQIGRGMRPCEETGKQDCIFLDHGGVRKEHGFVDDPVPWELNTDGKIQDRLRLAQEKLPREFKCADCGCIFTSRVRCPECGRRLEMQGRMANFTDGELVELKRGQKIEDLPYTDREKLKFYHELLGYASGIGRKGGKKYSHGWAAHKFRVKFGHWPDGLHKAHAEPTAITLAYIRSQNIRYAKRRKT